MTWSYNQAADKVTQAAGTNDDFQSGWVADRAGTLTIKNSTSTNSNLTYSLDTAMRPCDDMSLRISIVVSAWNNGGNAVTFAIVGVDHTGQAVNTSLKITGTGTYTLTGTYASVNANGLSLTATWISGMTWSATQPRWGRIWKSRVNSTTEQQYNKQFAMYGGTIEIAGNLIDGNGTGTNAGVDWVIGSGTFQIANSGSLQLGYMPDTNTAAASSRIVNLSTTFNVYGDLVLKNCHFVTTQMIRMYSGGTYDFNNVVFEGSDGIDNPTGSGIKAMNDVRICNCSAVGWKVFTQPINDPVRLKLMNNGYGVQAYGFDGTITFHNPIFADNAYDIIANGGGTRNLYFIDCTNYAGDSYTPTTNYISTGVTIYIQHHVNILINDSAGDPIKNVYVELSYDNHSWFYQDYTDTNGIIPEQTLTENTGIGFSGIVTWDPTPVIYYRLSHPDYETQTGIFPNNEQRSLVFTLELPDVPVVSTLGVVNALVNDSIIYTSLEE